MRFENLEGQRSGLLYEKIMTMQKQVYKTNLLSSGTYRELPINNQADLNIKSKDLSCAYWSILAKMFPAITDQKGTSIYEQHFIKSDMKIIDFTEGLKVEDAPKLESENKLNLNVFEPPVNVKDEISKTSEPLAVFFRYWEWTKPIITVLEYLLFNWKVACTHR